MKLLYVNAWKPWKGRIVGLRIMLEPRDVWVGCYWTYAERSYGVPLRHIYLCPLPFLVFKLTLVGGKIS